MIILLFYLIYLNIEIKNLKIRVNFHAGFFCQIQDIKEFLMNKEMRRLKEICNYLKKIDFSLSSNQNDGRIDSILNEDEILKLIEQKFDIDLPLARDWADFYIDKIPVNIKITTTNTADNASSKKGIYYALTGEIYNGNNNWDSYLKLLKENLRDSKKDYYFLVINKNNKNDIFFNSLKNISTLQANGNNLPFQIKWCNNKKLNPKNFEKTKKLILGTLGQSIKLRADAYISFQKYFSEYL